MASPNTPSRLTFLHASETATPSELGAMPVSLRATGVTSRMCIRASTTMMPLCIWFMMTEMA